MFLTSFFSIKFFQYNIFRSFSYFNFRHGNYTLIILFFSHQKTNNFFFTGFEMLIINPHILTEVKLNQYSYFKGK